MDFLRQISIFSPEKHKEKRVDVIGVGAVGSYMSWLLAKIGMENIHIWDDDTVMEHNLPNQCFLKRHIGELKVEAVSDMISLGGGVIPAIHTRKAVGEEKFGEVVFLLTDTMVSRKQIWEGALKYKLNTRLLVETRMGADSGRIYAINPSKPSHIKGWEGASKYSDEEAEKSACGASVSIAPTAALVASVAVWQMIYWFNGEDLFNEILISTNPWALVPRKF